MLAKRIWSQIIDMSSEQYILLAKGTRGLGLCNLIVQATGDKNLFAFGELLSLSSITEVCLNKE